MNTGSGLFLTVLLLVGSFVGLGVMGTKMIDYITENQTLKATLDRLQAQLDSEQAANQADYAEIQNLNEEISNLTRQLNQERAINQTLQDKINELNDRLAKVQGEYEAEKLAKDQALDKLAQIRSVEAFFENLKTADAGKVISQAVSLESPDLLVLGLVASAILAAGASISVSLMRRLISNRQMPISESLETISGQVDAPPQEADDTEFVNVKMTRSQASDYAHWRRSDGSQNGFSKSRKSNGKEKAHELGPRVDQDRWDKRSQGDLHYAV